MAVACSTALLGGGSGARLGTDLGGCRAAGGAGQPVGRPDRRARSSCWEETLEAGLVAQRQLLANWGDALERFLSLLTYLAPVGGDEPSSEAAFAPGFWSQLLSSANDIFALYRSAVMHPLSMLPVCADPRPRGGPERRPSRFSSSAGRMMRSRLIYSISSLLLKMTRAIQVLLEMHWTRGGHRGRTLILCLRVELAKLLMKIAVGSVMPFSFYVDAEAIETWEPVSATARDDDAVDAFLLRRDGQAPGSFVGWRTGCSLPGLAPLQRRRAVSHAMFQENCSNAGWKIMLAEVFFHGRPVLQLLLSLRYGTSSFRIWSIPVAIDLISLIILQCSTRGVPDTRESQLEVAELRRRWSLLVWALARSPVFDFTLRKPCCFLEEVCSKVPVLGVFNIAELALALQPFYFTTSAS